MWDNGLRSGSEKTRVLFAWTHHRLDRIGVAFPNLQR